MALSTIGILTTAAMPSLRQQRLSLPAPATTTTGLVVECSSRPTKKSTAHHIKTRPKKTQPWDIKRKGPTPYPPLPALPPDWTLVSSASSEEPPQQQREEAESAEAE